MTTRTAGHRSGGGTAPNGHKKRTPTYHSWEMMRRRCNNPNHMRYVYYGAKGVTVCDRWSSFLNFLADMGERPEGTTLDRIDVEGNYEPSNCRWATPKEQANNKRKKVSA